MLNTRILYSYNDVMIQPAIVSEINSRKECNPYVDRENKMLPIFTAPMSTVVDTLNYDLFCNNGIYSILPRNVDLSTRISYSKNGRWSAYSLNEFKEHFLNEYDSVHKTVWKVLIDVANGHMKCLYDCVRHAKELHGNDKIIIMVGNIANPETYFECYKAGVDYIRCGIGGGAGCFVDGTKITTKNGKKNIEDVEIGEKALTHDGSFHKILNKLRFKTSENKLCINNEITCTKNHKFLVINKQDKNKVTEKNLNDFSYWIEAEKLDKNIHLLIKMKEGGEDA